MKMMIKYTRWLLSTGLLVAATFLIFQLTPTYAQAGANCSSAYFIDETLPTGARWQMCWEHRNREGIVFYDIYYTSPDGTQRKVLAQAGLAQIHVPYDDNGARYHDVSDYGLGGSYMDSLDTDDCPDGTLLQYSGKNVLCQGIENNGYSYKYRNTHKQSYALRLFSVSHVGEYNYIPQWVFADDGTIEPSIGATGRLQRFGSNSQYGWELGNGRIGISHTHNYYWRLDFDLGENANNDVVEEFAFNSSGSSTRTISKTTLNTEAGRSAAPELMRSWRIRDGSITNADGHPISYHLEPFEVGHRFIGPSSEPWTQNDFYVTKYKSCEKYASHNPTTGGCAADLSTFVNGESLNGEDLVLWYGVTFHHLPRDEDEPYMHLHTSGFQLIQRDWMAESVLASINATPLPTNTPVAQPTATNTPVQPTATNTPVVQPTATNTPVLQPTATNTPQPAATNTPVPPTATNTPVPQPTATNTPSAPVCTVYTSSDTPISLPNGTSSKSSLVTATGNGTISDVNVNLNMSHAWVGDLSMTLTHVNSGTSVTILDRPGIPASNWGCRYNNIAATLDDEAAAPVENQCRTSTPTINGAFSPNNALGTFNGEESNGSWRLTVTDHYPSSDAGSLSNWSLEICTGGQVAAAADDSQAEEQVHEQSAALDPSGVESETIDTSAERPVLNKNLYLPVVQR